MKKRLLSLLVSLMLVLGTINVANVVNAEESSEERFATVSEITISDTTPDIGDWVDLSFKITVQDGVEIGNINFGVYNSLGGNTGSTPEYTVVGNVITVETAIEINYYGDWCIDYIDIWDADGRQELYYNPDSFIYTNWDNIYPLDMSSTNMTVNNTPIDDTTGPTIPTTGWSKSDAEPALNEYAFIVWPVSDDSGIARIECECSQANGASTTYMSVWYDESFGSWLFQIPTEYVGKVEIISVLAVDRCGNATKIYNSGYSKFNELDSDLIELTEDFSILNVTVGSGSPVDQTAPVLNTETLTVKEVDLGRNESFEISFNVEEESSLTDMQLFIQLGNGMQGQIAGNTSIDYNSETGEYVCSSNISNYYGLYEVLAIVLADSSGNKSGYINNACSFEFSIGYDVEWIEADLSGANFNVGIHDDSSGIFVTGAGMETDATLDVEEIEEEDNDYEILIEKDKTCEGYYDISMGGTYKKDGHKVKVQFDVSKLNNGHKHKDGDKLKIRHKCKNGSIQEEEVEVKDGKIWIDVSEFSPFMVLSEGTTTGGSNTDENGDQNNNQENNENVTPPVVVNGWVTLDNGERAFYDNGKMVKNKWVTGTDGQLRYINNKGIMVRDEFVCDGTYTYYLQYDGSPMKDRLTYHPDGIHVIYFDSQGHEVFSDFANVKMSIAGEPVDDYCFFDVYGYLYVDVVTYDKEGKNLYYANPYGVLERNKWFQFSDTVMCADGTPWNGAAGNFGYANADGTLMVNTYTYDWEGRLCYMQGNGVALY